MQKGYSLKLKSKIKPFSIYLMSIGYMSIGLNHFIDPKFFLNIMPPYLPYHLELVYISGAFEIILGFGLLLKKYRFFVSWGLIFLLISVYPANIYLAFSSEAQRALNISPFLASWVRLPTQFVFIAIAYWHSKP